MEIPELVQQHLGDEELQTGVKLGDEDVLCLTPTRTLLYRAEGLLSDESVTEFPHELESLRMADGRRKTKFVFEYVEDERTLTVPNNLTRDVLELLLEGVLTAERLLEDEEGVVGAFRFSELTLVVTHRRVVKHVGNAVWETDFETFDYEDLTGLAFEKASVATEIVLHVGGRPQRIKTPNDEARIVERAVKKAVFEYFDVDSMSQLQTHFESEADDDDDEDDAPDDLDFGSEIKPLGDDSESNSPFSEPEAETDEEEQLPTEPATAAPDSEGSTWDEPQTATDEPDRLTRADLDAIDDQLSELTTAVTKQNELLRKQHSAIQKLVEELRQGR